MILYTIIVSLDPADQKKFYQYQHHKSFNDYVHIAWQCKLTYVLLNYEFY